MELSNQINNLWASSSIWRVREASKNYSLQVKANLYQSIKEEVLAHQVLKEQTLVMKQVLVLKLHSKFNQLNYAVHLVEWVKI